MGETALRPRNLGESARGLGEGTSVDDGGAQSWVGEGLDPERFVGGDRDAMFLFAFGEKEHLGAAAVEFHLAEFVDAEKATMVRAEG